jgi:crotonobetainyl-CoA:carnitine CoA-transferase CaiB-like acyl-CoA transferase
MLDDRLAEWAARVALDDAVELLTAAGVPAAPAVDPRRTSQHPQFVARRYYEDVDHPVVGCRAVNGLPFRLGHVERWLRTPAPTLGQHNREILLDLGLSDDEIAALEEDDVIGQRPLGL